MLHVAGGGAVVTIGHASHKTGHRSLSVAPNDADVHNCLLPARSLQSFGSAWVLHFKTVVVAVVDVVAVLVVSVVVDWVVVHVLHSTRHVDRKLGPKKGCTHSA